MKHAQRGKRGADAKPQRTAEVAPGPSVYRDAARLALVLVVVASLVSVAHWPALSARTISFDDNQYLVDNYLVQRPSWASAGQFLREVLEPSTVEGYYQPLAMISLMFDCAAGGRPDNLVPFHRTSLALHVMNTSLIIVLLYMLFGQVWIAAMVGLLFGVHPITVEPIPWIGERKTLLAAFFSLGCLVLYVRYTRWRNRSLYLACLVAYVLALLSKPTSTPLAVLLLLLDYWPLRRLSRRAVLEKVPFFVTAGVFAVITFVSQARTAAVEVPGEYSPGRIPLILCHNIVFYLYKIVAPMNLSSHYPFPEPLGLSAPMVLAGVIGTCALIALLLVSLRWTRALLTGWLLFFVALLPTMGIIGFTNVIASDKYAYLPSVGLLLVIAWLLDRCWSASRRARNPMAARVAVCAGVGILAGAEAIATWRQAERWRDTTTLYRHMLSLAPRVPSLHNGLGYGLAMAGRTDEAIAEYTEALRLDPDFQIAHYNLGIALVELGRDDEAIRQFEASLKLRPKDANCLNNMALALAKRGRRDEAVTRLTEAMRLRPGDAEIPYNLANILAEQGRLDDAVRYYGVALEYEPHSPSCHTNLGNVLFRQKKPEEALRHYRAALAIDPSFLFARINLGNVLRSLGKLEEATAQYQEAVRMHPNDATAHFVLGVTLDDQGKLDAAISEYRRTLEIAPTHAQARERLNKAMARRGARGSP